MRVMAVGYTGSIKTTQRVWNGNRKNIVRFKNRLRYKKTDIETIKTADNGILPD